MPATSRPPGVRPAEPAGRTARKHAAILAAAEELFLANGYLGTNMDDVAARSQVSKQTVYKHFGSKDALFVGLVSAMTRAAGDRVHHGEDPAPDGDVCSYLGQYGLRQLDVVMSPRLLQLRRLVIGEVSRFPELARALYESGPQRAIESLTAAFAKLDARGLLVVDDPRTAAKTFNWLVMAAPLNEAMLLGDDAIPGTAARQRHVEQSVRVFLAAYGR